ncbi:MAG: sialidase family protein [Actinomycetota bacterium]
MRASRLPAAIVVAGIAILGSATAPSTTAGAAAAQPEFTGTAVAHYPGGVLPPEDQIIPVPAVELFGTAFTGTGEPTIGVGRDGTLYSDDLTKTVVSTDHGKTWRDISPSNNVPASLDPYLYLDPVTNRLFKSDLIGTCQHLAFSDDEGTSWTRLPAACNLSDHQTIAAGPPATSQTVGYQNVVYDCSQSAGYNGYSAASICDKSIDGGRTWVPTGTPAYHDPSPYGFGPGSGDSGVPGHCNGDIGHIFVGSDGALYVPRGWCGQPWLAVSHDEGATWTRTQVASNGMNTTVTGGFGLVAPGSGQSDHEAAVVADTKGNLFYMWMGLDRLPWLAVSRDHGATWSSPLMIGAPGVNEAWGPALGIDPDGRVSVAYMGTSGSPGAPWTGDYANVAWFGYVAVIPKPLDTRPLIFSAATSSASRPFVKGTCGPDRCDPVLDFIDVQSATDGSAWAAFVDAPRSKRLVVAHLAPPPPPAAP